MKQNLNTSEYKIDDNLEQYISLKHELMKNRLIRNDVDVIYSNIDISCYDYKLIDNELEVIFNVLVSHQYDGCNFLSESMQQVKLGFAFTNNKIIINNYFEFNGPSSIDNLQYTDDTIEALVQLYEEENNFYDSIFSTQ